MSEINYPEDKLKEKVLGKDLTHAPQPAITALSTANGGVLSSSPAGDALSQSDSAILTSLIVRVKDLETNLIKLGLIRHK